MTAGVVYHWKHGWIPLDHAAALSKAKGNHEAAERMLRDAHNPDAGIRSQQDVAKATLSLKDVPSADRDSARLQVKAGAIEHDVHHLLPKPMQGLNEAQARANDAAKANVHDVDRLAGDHYANTGTTHIRDRSGAVHEIAKVHDGLVYTKQGRIFTAGSTSSQARGETHRLQDAGTGDALAKLEAGARTSQAPDSYNAAGGAFQRKSAVIAGKRVQYVLNENGEERWFVNGDGPYRDRQQVLDLIGTS